MIPLPDDNPTERPPFLTVGLIGACVLVHLWQWSQGPEQMAAVLAQALPNTESSVPMIGASGAISGVLGAYFLLYPKARVQVLIPFGFFLHTIRLKAAVVLAIWFVIQVLISLTAGDGPGVAWFAHIGGFVAGVVVVPYFKQRQLSLFQPA